MERDRGVHGKRQGARGMNLIDQVTRLKEQAGRLDAIKARQRETGKPNHALLERIDIERGLANAAPAMLEVLGGFRQGDARLLSRMTATHRCPNESDPDKKYLPCASCLEEREILRRMQAMAARMEAKQ